MSAPLKLLPLPFVLLSALPAVAQEVPRVLFCSGPCFAVDAKGVRTPAPKGTELAPGQRLETGPGGYAQVKLGRDAALGIGDQAKVRFERSAVVLDEGRLRMVGGQVLGKPVSRPIELRTGDGALVLRSADVEVKKTAGVGAAATPTFVKVNAGDASLRSGPKELALPRQAVQGITAGKILTGTAIPESAVVPATRTTGAAARTAPVSGPALATPKRLGIEPVAMTPMSSPTLSATIPTQPILTPVVAKGDYLLSAPLVDSSTGTTTTLTKVITEPVLTTTTTTSTTSLKTLTLQPISTTTTLSPTLSTTTTTLLR